MKGPAGVSPTLNGTTTISSTLELVTETAETMIQQFVLQALEKKKKKNQILPRIRKKPIQTKINREINK